MVSTASLDWLQTLADGTRVRLLRLLADEELSVSELCTVVQLPQSTVSRHLKVLSADGWISNRRDGTNQLYCAQAELWCDSRRSLWSWVREQGDSPTTFQDQQRLQQVMAQRSRSEAFFSSSAENWDKLRFELFGNQIDSFVLAAALPRNAVVAELGCGSAALSRLVSPYVQQVIAVDNSEAMLAAAKQRLADCDNVCLRRSSLENLSLEDDLLDLAWLVLVLPYVDDVVPVLAEAKRVLRDGAALVIVDLSLHERSTYCQEMGHVRLGVDRAELERWLSKAGLQLQSYHSLPPDPEAKGPALFSAVARKQLVTNDSTPVETDTN